MDRKYDLYNIPNHYLADTQVKAATKPSSDNLVFYHDHWQGFTDD